MAQPGSRLDVISEDPYNAETVPAQHTGVITPNSSFYKRNHFSIPQLDPSTWELRVDALLAGPAGTRVAVDRVGRAERRVLDGRGGRRAALREQRFRGFPRAPLLRWPRPGNLGREFPGLYFLSKLRPVRAVNQRY